MGGPLTSLHGGRSLQTMLRSGILNPHLLSLLARVRHTNRLVIADSMFPAWPGIETVDLALVYGIPTVPQVVAAIVANWKAGHVWMASEFHDHNDAAVRTEFLSAFGDTPVIWEPHLALKARVPGAVGLIRTGEQRIYTNVVLESA
jgi:D-ribose pyranase